MNRLCKGRVTLISHDWDVMPYVNEETKPEDIKKLQEQNFTIREIEILSKIPKSSVARELKEMRENE